MDLKKRVMSGLRWSAAAKFVAQLVTWAITVVVIRILSPADYGLMELAGVFVAFLAMLNELGLGAAVIQRKDLDEDALKSLFGLVLLASVLFYGSLWAMAPLIADFYEEPRLTLLTRVLALQFLLMGFTVLPQSILLRDMEFRKIATVDFLSAIAGSLTTLVLALSGQGVWSLVWGSLTIRVVSVAGLNLARPYFGRPALTLKGMGWVVSFGGYVTLSRILWYFYSRADTLIIGKALGKELLGFYAIGFYLASLPMEKVSGIINQVAFPAFSSVQAEPGAAGRHFLKAVRVLSFFAFPILWGIASLAPEIVALFLGAKWSDAALPLQIIALVIPVRMVSNLMSPALLGAGRPDVSFFNSLVAFVLMPLSFLIGARWGLAGVSLAWAIGFPVVFVLNLWRSVEVLEVEARDVFNAMKMPFISGLVMYAGVVLCKQIDVPLVPLFLKLAFWSFCGAFIYIAINYALNQKAFREIIELART